MRKVDKDMIFGMYRLCICCGHKVEKGDVLKYLKTGACLPAYNSIGQTVAESYAGGQHVYRSFSKPSMAPVSDGQPQYLNFVSLFNSMLSDKMGAIAI
jgi:hypothetical protein